MNRVSVVGCPGSGKTTFAAAVAARMGVSRSIATCQDLFSGFSAGQATPNLRRMARKEITMSPSEVLEFLEAGRTLIVTTHGPDGWPHVAPMWYAVRDGQVVFRSFTKSQKIVNLRRDPRLTILLETGDAYAELRGVMIKGTAQLVDDPAEVLEMYGELSGRYAFVGTEPVKLEGAALEEAFGRFAAKNTGVIVQPEQTISWDHTKLEGAY